MWILGIIVISVLPYMAGYIIRTLIRDKEIGQSETYLIGFFFIFFLQGIVFSTGYMIADKPFDTLCSIYSAVTVCIGVLFAIALITNIILFFIKGKKEIYRLKIRSTEWILLALMLVIAALIVVRVFYITDYIRDDYMLPTVRMTVSTNTINVYNPITGRPYELGLITSRKIITLPVYYACLCKVYDINTMFLLYIVATLQTVVCTYLSCVLFITPVLKQRGRIYLFGIFLGAVILSGDYFTDAIGAKLLWRGYAGDTIVAAVMLPYALSVIVSDYRQVYTENSQNDEHGRKVISVRIKSIFKLMLLCVASLFITGVAKGLLLIVITIALAVICYAVALKKQIGVDDGSLFVGE